MSQDLNSVFSDEKFLNALRSCKTTEDAAKLFNENGVKVNAQVLEDALLLINAVKENSTAAKNNNLEEDELPDDYAEQVAGGGKMSSSFQESFGQIFNIIGDNPMVVSIMMENFGGAKASQAAANLRAVAFLIEDRYGIPLYQQTMQMATDVLNMIETGNL